MRTFSSLLDFSVIYFILRLKTPLIALNCHKYDKYLKKAFQRAQKLQDFIVVFQKIKADLYNPNQTRV